MDPITITIIVGLVMGGLGFGGGMFAAAKIGGDKAVESTTTIDDASNTEAKAKENLSDPDPVLDAYVRAWASENPLDYLSAWGLECSIHGHDTTGQETQIECERYGHARVQYLSWSTCSKIDDARVREDCFHWFEKR